MRTAGLICFLGMTSVAAWSLQTQAASPSEADRQAVLELADRVFAAARARDGKRFASFFSEDPSCVYVLNHRILRTKAVIEDTFVTLLQRQRRFDPQWSERTVQLPGPGIGILTGTFSTTAERVSGEAWQARGTVTFVAIKGSEGWRVVNWHTSE